MMTDRAASRRRRLLGWAGCVTFIILGGCKPGPTELRIESYTQGGDVSRFVERFDRCFFSGDDRGTWDIVWLASRPSAVESDGEMQQVFHARLIWRPVPGETFAERTQTNSVLCYALIDVDRAVSYEGAGFVTFTLDRLGGQMIGQVESGSLAPTRSSGAAADLLGRCLVSGSFVARRNPGQVVASLNMLRRRLGPPRSVTPSGAGRDIR